MKKPSNNLKKLEVHAPSNIAFVKYWGKFGRQEPINPSISMTLNSCKTITELEYSWGSDRLNHLETTFDGKPSISFHNRLNKYLHSLTDDYPRLKEINLKIHSRNTFPHSAGIASSASAYGAIGIGLASILAEQGVSDKKLASHLARLGSGSASRSIEGPFVRWGKSIDGTGSNQFAERIEDIHKEFHDLMDCILLVDEGEKSVSSSDGHRLMENHIYKKSRINQANDNFKELLASLKSGDVDSFIRIVENEALSLHALMMSSNPSYILLKPNSLAIIEIVKRFRRETKIPLCFTIDAGPNIHLIYPGKFKNQVQKLIDEDLKQFCENSRYIIDQAGSGAKINDK